MGKNDVKVTLQREIEQRIKKIEDPNYQYVARLNRSDYVGMVVTAIVCVIIILYGVA